MVRKDVSENERQWASADAAETAPVRALSEVLDDIRSDASASATQYLTETEVPYGGE